MEYDIQDAIHYIEWRTIKEIAALCEEEEKIVKKEVDKLYENGFIEKNRRRYRYVNALE